MEKKLSDTYIRVQTILVNKDFEGSRLDNCLISLISGIPHSRIYSMIRRGEVRVNSSRSKPDRRLKINDVIRIPPYKVSERKTTKPSQLLIKLIKENIVYNQDHVLVINKPEGLASHGGSGLKLGLNEAVRQSDSSFKNAQLVHRLDKDTSGCIVLALKRSILRSLNKELREGRVEKKYLAVVNGIWPEGNKTITNNLKKNILRSGEREVKISEDGKKSVSHFKLLKKTNKLSLVECELITGRMHQIRVQTSYEGHAIIGDKKYGDDKINKIYQKKGIKRMLLHSKSISFPEFGLFFSCNEPAIFKKILN